jgi:hypothetical protein
VITTCPPCVRRSINNVGAFTHLWAPRARKKNPRQCLLCRNVFKYTSPVYLQV